MLRVKIDNFQLKDLCDGVFIRLRLAVYLQDGEERSWEVLEAGDSVAVLIYHREHDSFVFVRQFRPAVYMKNGDGMTIELCAGLMDKNLSAEEIASEEIEEECGYAVSPDSLFRINSFYTSVGFAGTRQILYYAEVDESMRNGPGGGIEGENIETVEIPVNEIEEWMADDSEARSTGLLYAVEWWLRRNRR